MEVCELSLRHFYRHVFLKLLLEGVTELYHLDGLLQGSHRPQLQPYGALRDCAGRNKSGAESLGEILPDRCQRELPAGTEGIDVFIMDNHRLLPLGPENCLLHLFFFTFRVRWVLSHRFTTLPLYADGVLFLCIKPQDGCVSRGFDDTIISVISASAAVTGTEQGSGRWQPTDHTQDVDLFSTSRDAIRF